MLRTGIRTMATSRPIVAVIGTTGVGKSQLAVSLAQSIANRPSPVAGPSKTAGIVLSADSMQLYKGLDVITNKVTLDEMGGVEHWGLDVVQPGQGESWELGKWCTEAERKVRRFDVESR
jgi:tRNA dimethylallyltransferase